MASTAPRQDGTASGSAHAPRARPPRAARSRDSRPAPSPRARAQIWQEHCGEGFELKTDDDTFSCYADGSEECERWVQALRSAVKVGARRQSQRAIDGASASLPQEMPPQPQLDELVSEMLEAQGEKEHVRIGIMQLSDANKWQLYQGYAATRAAEAGDIKDAPEHWCQLLNLEPTKTNLEELSVMLRQKPVSWVNEFIDLSGVTALSDLLELLEKKAFKKPSDFELMAMVLRCLRSLMNLENGMDAILGLLDDDEPQVSTPGGRRPAAVARGGLRQLALCIDSGGRESTEARAVQCQALTLLSAAALYSDDGHAQVGPLPALILSRPLLIFSHLLPPSPT